MLIKWLKRNQFLHFKIEFDSMKYITRKTGFHSQIPSNQHSIIYPLTEQMDAIAQMGLKFKDFCVKVNLCFSFFFQICGLMIS